MTCQVVAEGVVVCDGRSGDWRVRRKAWCPWCCVKGESVRALGIEVYGGYGGSELICGSCGFEWALDDYWYPRMNPHDQERRDKNIALVAATPDPKCWDCHDTGDTGIPGFHEPDTHPCNCGAKRDDR